MIRLRRTAKYRDQNINVSIHYTQITASTRLSGYYQKKKKTIYYFHIGSIRQIRIIMFFT